MIKAKKFNALIQDQLGHAIYQKKNILAPETWSQTAVDIAASKYFRKSVKQENSIYRLIDRIGSGFQTALLQNKYLNSKKEVSVFINEIKELMLNQKAAFNSPVWFNCGLSEMYQVQSKSLHFVWSQSQKKVIEIHDAFLSPQCSACFIQSVDDELESIFELVKSEAKLFKYGSGSGTNFTKLRSKYEPLNSGGTSSGLISFLEVLDKSAGAIKSGGTTRRAAKMVCVDIDHPEILDFIQWKKKEELKAHALIAQGYSAALDGEAYHTVSGQNANNSVRLSNTFMKKVLKKELWNLKSQSTGQVLRTVQALDLWNELCESAWFCADPGVQFSDTINEWHTCKNTDLIHASNPCSEYLFLDDSACNLASLNLVKFFCFDQKNLNQESKIHFKTDQFLKAIEQLILTQESLVDYASYPTQKIAQNSHDYRPLGLGFANLGSLLMRMGLSYDSDEARAWAAMLSALMTGQAYLTSTQLAEKLGPFVGFKKNKKSMLQVLKKHRSALRKIHWKLLPKELKLLVHHVWAEVIFRSEKYGVRNAQVTVIAPTGTIGLVMDCDTTGVEPDFSLIKYKKLSGGGQIKIVNQAVSDALKTLKYSEDEAQSIFQAMLHEKDFFTMIKPEHHSVFWTAQGSVKSGANFEKDILKPEAHLQMMAAVQPFISGAISKTVNLPSSATQKDISDIYFQAWQLGLKAVAIYRDGSKRAQPLNINKKDDLKKAVVSEMPTCTFCGGQTQLESGCYRCLNCGTTTSCAS